VGTAGTTARRARILVVEDERLVALDIGRSLEELGFEVVGTASSGEEALDAVASERPDLVLMDVHLRGELDGIETARRLRMQHDVAIAYLTGHGDAETIERAKQAAPGGLLIKPFKQADLYGLVEIELHRAHAERMSRRARDREQLLATVLTCVGDAVISTDTSLTITFMNPAAQELVGWSLDEARGRQVDEVVQLRDESTGALLPAVLLETLWGRSPCRVHAATLVTRLGAIRHVSQSAAPVLAGDELLGAVVAITDVTDQRRAAKELEVAERMTSLARHSKAIAHDVNNALTIVGANLSYASDRLGAVAVRPDTPLPVEDAVGESRRALADAGTGIGRIEQIVRRLKMFGADESSVGAVDLADVLRWAVGVTERQWRSRARVRLDLHAMPRVEADEARVGQVFLELVLRAATASAGDGGQLQAIEIVGSRDANGRAIVRISTTGMPKEVGGRSRPSHRSPLEICKSIVEDLGGELVVESRADSGDAVTVSLPGARVLRLSPQRRPISALGPGRRGKVLVIDDEELVGQVVTRVLSTEHDVVAVLSAAEAIDLMGRGTMFDAVICDVVMHGVGGVEMFQWVRTQHPMLVSSFMFLTGGAIDEDTARKLDELPAPRLDKPFRPADLRRMVAALVNRKQ
jgi:PAS domain S-box-containing protein